MNTKPTSNRSRLRSFADLILMLPVAAMVLGIVGCLPMPVGDPEKSVVDKDLIGVWLIGKGGSLFGDKSRLCVVHAYDKRTYIVNMYQYKNNDGTIKPESFVPMKGWLTKLGGKQFISLDIINDKAAAGLEKKHTFYIVARVEKKPGVIKLKLTNLDSSLFKDVTTTAQAEAVLAKHADNPKAFINAITMKRADKSDAILIKSVLKAFQID